MKNIKKPKVFLIVYEYNAYHPFSNTKTRNFGNLTISANTTLEAYTNFTKSHDYNYTVLNIIML